MEKQQKKYLKKRSVVQDYSYPDFHDDGLFDFGREKDDCEYLDISEEEFWGRIVRRMPNRTIGKKQ